MMCEVMPTISEGDSAGPPRGTGGVPNGSDQEANFEQLMVNMLDERDKLLESLRETQETLIQSQTKLQGALHERDVLQRQINACLLYTSYGPTFNSRMDQAEQATHLDPQNSRLT
ncbi:liprin-alpha-4-like [Seriola lalandi dorsalis]|uniref:liprin-alpha-4-like n=1 Tax=Seriola lalandi dorsalis TaxID=1841481 RepID=UPI000C6FCB80|nr:liprin-alpha-4-like [Seriola lalandi dorsalis]